MNKTIWGNYSCTRSSSMVLLVVCGVILASQFSCSGTKSGSKRNICIQSISEIVIRLPKLDDLEDSDSLVFKEVKPKTVLYGGCEFETRRPYWIMAEELSNAQAASLFGYESYSDFRKDMVFRLDSVVYNYDLFRKIMKENMDLPTNPYINIDINTAYFLARKIALLQDSEGFTAHVPNISQWVCAASVDSLFDRDFQRKANWGQGLGVVYLKSIESNDLYINTSTGYTDACELRNMFGNVAEFVIPTLGEVEKLNSTSFAKGVYSKKWGVSSLFTGEPVLMGGSVFDGVVMTTDSGPLREKKFGSFTSRVRYEEVFFNNRYIPSVEEDKLYQELEAGVRFIIRQRSMSY